MIHKIIKYAGITLIVIGIGVLSYHFINNYIIARKELAILTAWESESTNLSVGDELEVNEQTTDESEKDKQPVKETKLVDPEQKLPFKITIPEIDMEWIVNEGTDYATLKKGPGFYLTSTLPGETGTTVVCGHRTTYGAPFNRLNELETGDEIIIETEGNELFTYLVTEQIEVVPTDTSVLDNTDYPSLVLSTCTPKYFSTRRLVIFAKLEE